MQVLTPRQSQNTWRQTTLFNHTFYETNFKPKLFTANFECNGTVIKQPKTEKNIPFLNLNSRSILQWWRPRALVHFQPCCTLSDQMHTDNKLSWSNHIFLC